ncbi:MAG TPA: hypothetical protein VGP27_21840 [Mycobacterium sp.]|nr:hypothetical protein [Mycobacterium sp.]
MFTAHVVEVAIATPRGDGLRAAVVRAADQWNAVGSRRHQIVLAPSFGQASTRAAEDLDHADVSISVFDPMQPNLNEAIGDVVHSRRSGTLALVWLSAESPSDIQNADDQARLRQVTQRLACEGVVPRFIGHRDSAAESRVYEAIAADLPYSDLSALIARFESRAAARRVATYRSPVPLLGPQICAVTVMNHSTFMATGLSVTVDAVDSHGNLLTDGAQRSTQALADVVAKLRVGPDAPAPTAGPSSPAGRMEILASHTALRYPRWLRPHQRASGLYVLALNASLRVRIEFEDETGASWSRTNDAEPERVREGHWLCP